jgi:hypothetical protein
MGTGSGTEPPSLARDLLTSLQTRLRETPPLLRDSGHSHVVESVAEGWLLDLYSSEARRIRTPSSFARRMPSKLALVSSPSSIVRANAVLCSHKRSGCEPKLAPKAKQKAVATVFDGVLRFPHGQEKR